MVCSFGLGKIAGFIEFVFVCLDCFLDRVVAGQVFIFTAQQRQRPVLEAAQRVCQIVCDIGAELAVDGVRGAVVDWMQINAGAVERATLRRLQLLADFHQRGERVTAEFVRQCRVPAFAVAVTAAQADISPAF